MIDKNMTLEQADDEYIDLIIKERDNKLTDEDKQRMIELEKFMEECCNESLLPEYMQTKEFSEGLNQIINDLNNLLEMFDNKEITKEQIKDKAQQIFNKEKKLFKPLRESEE